MKNSYTDGRRIRSVEITLNILKTLRSRNQSTITELAEDLGHSKSTIHSHVRTLEEQEVVVYDRGGYRLSLRILDVANSVREQVCDYDIVVEELDRLAKEVGAVAQFGLEEYGQVSYLYKARSDQTLETASRVGKKQPIYSTSIGKAILAHLPDERTEEIIANTEFNQLGPNTITEPAELHEELKTIVEQGYAIDNEENIEGIRCVAAPVKNDETVLGAVSITEPATWITDDRLHSELADSVRRTANVIELNTKFS